jgi:hypothetical protein
MSFIGKLREAAAQQAQREADPWRGKLEAWLHGTPEISTAAALDLLGLANTSSNARQLARTMRALGFISIKSKRLMPGRRDANMTTRGWSRPFREMKSSRPRVGKGEKVSGERIER